MSEPSVSIQGLGKKYRLQHRQEGMHSYSTLRDLLTNAFSPARWFGTREHRHSTVDDFWALRNVTFDVAQGDVVGIIGRNGAGKSTLLKLLSRITEPTEGRIVLDGRIASLLEVGTGFHPELTGRENVFLNGSIIGMRRAEIVRKLDEIVAFAEVEAFIDTPVKRYSSGMYLRLAFSVAAHLEPEILVVDEVLAVGDAEFQRRCLGKMRDVSAGGRTVLFVSHNLTAVQALCNRAVWLDHGTVEWDGGVDEGIRRYLTRSLTPTTIGSGQAVKLGPSLEVTRFEMSPNPVESGMAAGFSMTLSASAANRVTDLALLVYSTQEVRVAIVDIRQAGLPVQIAAGESWTVGGSIKGLPLVEGDYRLGVFATCSDFSGDRLGLGELRVTARPNTSGFAPYPAMYRGFVECDVTFDHGRATAGGAN